MPQMRAVMSGASLKARPPQKTLEEARRLEDVELGVLDLAVPDRDLERAFAFDPGERADFDGSGRHDL